LKETFFNLMTSQSTAKNHMVNILMGVSAQTGTEVYNIFPKQTII